MGKLSITAKKKGQYSFTHVEVARERFELSSKAPEASMLNRYTTGLHYSTLTLKLHCNNFNVAP
jgi:hypothetical protein